MSIEPAESDTGIVFERTDLKNNNFIKAAIDNGLILDYVQK